MNQLAFDLPPPWLEELMSRNPKSLETRCIDCKADSKGWLRCTECDLEARQLNLEERDATE